MCYGIAWYHALCLHPNPTPLYHIACDNALKTGDYCYSWECISIPMIGACEKCTYRKSVAEDDHYVLARETPMETLGEEDEEDEEEDGYEMVEEDGEEGYFSDDGDDDENGDGLGLFHRVTF